MKTHTEMINVIFHVQRLGMVVYDGYEHIWLYGNGAAAGFVASFWSL